MPLKKSSSQQALHDNIKAELAAGKSQKQAVAIGLSVQRKAKEKKKNYSKGAVELAMAKLH